MISEKSIVLVIIEKYRVVEKGVINIVSSTHMINDRKRYIFSNLSRQFLN